MTVIVVGIVVCALATLWLIGLSFGYSSKNSGTRSDETRTFDKPLATPEWTPPENDLQWLAYTESLEDHHE